MSRIRLADLRTKLESIDDAVAALKQAALFKREINVQEAIAKRRKTKIDAELAEKTAAMRKHLDDYLEHIKTFILANTALFKKPRKRSTEFGDFGLQASTQVVISDEHALIEHLQEQGYDDCVKVVRKPQKPAIKKRLKAGEQMPGVSLVTGDCAFAEPAKDFVNPEAVKN